MNSELVDAEVGRRTEDPDAFDYILRGRASDAMPPTRDKYAQAIELFERALALDPRSVEAQNRLAIAPVARVLDQMTSSAAAGLTAPIPNTKSMLIDVVALEHRRRASLDDVLWPADGRRWIGLDDSHGAMYLYDAGARLQKYTWVNTGKGSLHESALSVRHLEH